MKKFIFLIIFICLFQISSAQEIDIKTSPEVTKSKVDSLLSSVSKIDNPKANQSSKGGAKLYEFIGKNYQLPNVPGLKGKVVVSYVINEYGRIGDFKVLENLGYGTAEELIRVLKMTDGKWKPTIKDGKAVKTSYYVPLKIDIPE
jgi:hypothetical protein